MTPTTAACLVRAIALIKEGNPDFVPVPISSIRVGDEIKLNGWHWKVIGTKRSDRSCTLKIAKKSQITYLIKAPTELVLRKNR